MAVPQRAHKAGCLEVLTGPGTCIVTPFSSMSPGKQREVAEDCADREGWVRKRGNAGRSGILLFQTGSGLDWDSWRDRVEWGGF